MTTKHIQTTVLPTTMITQTNIPIARQATVAEHDWSKSDKHTSKQASVIVIRVGNTRQTKVADLQIACGVE
jgi:hypothetical protein